MSVNPLHHIYLSINSREAGLPAEVPPADDAPQVGDAQLILTDQRTSAVPLTGVHTAIQIACAHHAGPNAISVEPLAVGDEGHVGPEEHLTGSAVCEHSKDIWKRRPGPVALSNFQQMLTENTAADGRTCGSPPPRDAAGVVGPKELGGPGNTDGADGRVVLQTFVLVGKLLQLHQSDVVLIVAGVVPAGRRFHSLVTVIPGK